MDTCFVRRLISGIEELQEENGYGLYQNYGINPARFDDENYLEHEEWWFSVRLMVDGEFVWQNFDYLNRAVTFIEWHTRVPESKSRLLMRARYAAKRVRPHMEEEYNKQYMANWRAHQDWLEGMDG